MIESITKKMIESSTKSSTKSRPKSKPNPRSKWARFCTPLKEAIVTGDSALSEWAFCTPLEHQFSGSFSCSFSCRISCSISWSIRSSFMWSIRSSFSCSIRSSQRSYRWSLHLSANLGSEMNYNKWLSSTPVPGVLERDGFRSSFSDFLTPRYPGC